MGFSILYLSYIMTGKGDYSTKLDIIGAYLAINDTGTLQYNHFAVEKIQPGVFSESAGTRTNLRVEAVGYASTDGRSFSGPWRNLAWQLPNE